MKRALLVAILCVLVGCGDDSSGNLGDDGTEIPDGQPAPYVEVGEPIDEGDPTPGYDPCLDDDICPDDSEDENADSTDSPSGSDGPYQAGDLLLVLKYAPLRQQPNQGAGVKPVHPNGGVHGGHPKGGVPPGQVVLMLAEPRTNGFYQVEYRGYQGWIYGKKLALVDETVHPVKFARRSTIRNAFFMHQIKRSKWNKDGPYGSANCAPTSLAMAAKIFDLATRGRTIERGIHEARDSYGAPADESIGTSRAQIRDGAKSMGFNVKELGTNLSSASDEMLRLDQQLGWKRVVVLEGQAYGSQGAAYRSRMTAAYHAAGVTNRTYTYQGRHSILVVSRLDNGKYLVADPLSEVGMVTMSRVQLKSFIKHWGGTGNALYQ